MSAVLTNFTDILAQAARLASANRRHRLALSIELDAHGLLIIGRSTSAISPDVVREYKQVTSYHDAEVSDGRSITEKMKEVVKGLTFEFVEI